MCLRWKVAALAALVCAPIAARAQATPAPLDTSGQVVQVFLDCQRTFCDFDFIRQEIGFVNFVRDRQLAGVHVIITEQETGGAAARFTLDFVGLGARAAMRDTLVFSTRMGDTQDDIRRALVRRLAQGLVRYAAGTSADGLLQVSFRSVSTPASGASRGTKDRWNYWVYRVSTNANLDGNSNFESQNYGTRLSANRVTDAWKLQFNARGEYARRTVQLNDGEISVIQREFGGGADVIRSLGPHWSAGVNVVAAKDLFKNYDLNLSVQPGIEYNVFPYAEANRRQLLLRYSAGVQAFNYTDSTIYGRLREARPAHAFIVAADAVQPWGNVGVTVRASQYLHDLSKRQLGVFGSSRWRIVRGLDFNVGGGYSYIRDQLNIRGAGLSDEERIIQLREQQTNYSYFVFTGLSFTFGSAFNNVVNTRFGGGDRFFFFN